MSYPVAEDFDRVYSYLGARLVQANVKKDTFGVYCPHSSGERNQADQNPEI